MRQFFTVLTCAYLLLHFSPSAWAQCNPALCTIPVPQVNAIDACVLPNPQSLHCYYGQTTPDSPQTIPPVWCSDIDNNHWFAFTATTVSTFFSFTVFDCSFGSGIQVAILSTTDCVNFELVTVCKGIGTLFSQTLIVPNLIVGEVYYLCIDGTDGALCEYSINGENPAVSVGGSPDVCIPSDPTSTYTTSGISSWTINPPGAGMFVGNPVSNVVTVNWLQSGPAEVCAQNVACPDAPLKCIDVWVRGGLSEQTVNLCEGKTVSCAGQTYSTPGVYEVYFDTGNNCDSTVRCFVQLIPTDTTNETHAFCPGDSVRCAGKYFGMPGNFPVKLQTPQGCDSIVKCQINIIPIDTSNQVVNLCGPVAFALCGSTYTASGLYTATCVSALGCDSIIQLDLAILQPKAVLATPALLGCDMNATVTLFLSSWTQNTAIGGATLYKWFGPGIVGPSNQQTVQVNQPGEYCLVLTHARGTVFCADTVCATVIASGSAPQMPQLVGDENPCANTATVYTAMALGFPLPDSYTWNTSGNITFTQISADSITIQWPDTLLSGQICVAANDSCGASQATCISIVVIPTSSNATIQLCQGETIWLGGALQNTSGIYLDTLLTANGCDSIRTTVLIINPIDTATNFSTTCIPAEAGTTTGIFMQTNGCDSIVITTISLLPSDSIWFASSTCDASAIGVFVQNLNNQFGCDSVVTTTVTLSPTDSTFYYTTTCDPAAAGIFVEIYTDAQGCDSVLISTVTGLPRDTSLLYEVTCDLASAGVFFQNLTNQYGCDSLVITTTTWVASDTTNLAATTCDQTNAGVFTQMLLNQNGCDSLVITTISLLPSDTTLLFATTCDPVSAGMFVQMLSNTQGCDSLIITTVELLPTSQTLLESSTCDSTQVGSTVQIWSNQYGCDSIVTSVVNLLPPASCSINLTLTVGNIPCNTTTGSLILTAILGEAPFEYTVLSSGLSLANGNITVVGVPQILSGLMAGNYTVEIISANGLSATAQASIVQLLAPSLNIQPTSDYQGFAVSCANEMDGSVQAMASAGLAPYSFAWSNGQVTVDINALGAGLYTVTVTDANNCTNTASITLIEPMPLNISFIVNDLNCFGNNNGAIQVETSGGVAPYRYSLGNNTFQNTNLFSNLDAGTYIATTSDANDCQQTEIIVVNASIPVTVDLGPDQTISLGGTTILQAVVNLPLDSILLVAWTPPFDTSDCTNCLEQIVTPFASTTYSVKITALNGCSGTDKITVIVDRSLDLFKPNIFSPNGDGENDLFRIFAKPGLVRQFKSFQIFDRWGELIYAFDQAFTPDDNVGWDGKFDGRLMNPGVFIWVIEVEFANGEKQTVTGNVTLAR